MADDNGWLRRQDAQQRLKEKAIPTGNFGAGRNTLRLLLAARRLLRNVVYQKELLFYCIRKFAQQSMKNRRLVFCLIWGLGGVIVGQTAPARNPDSGLVAYWNFENGTATDLSGNGHDATLMGDPQVTAGALGNALFFDGSDDFFELAEGLNFSGSFSMTFWIQYDSVVCAENWYSLFQKGEGCPDGNPDYRGTAYSLALGAHISTCNDSVSGCGFINGQVISPQGNFFDPRIRYVARVPILPDQLYFVGVVFDYPARVFTVYLDGQAVPTDNFYEAGGTLDCAPIQPQDFTALHQTPAPFKGAVSEEWCGGVHNYGHHFRGVLDEIRFYDRALTSEEILELFQLVTDIAEAPTGKAPAGFVLNQNYPNPFNPGTLITYMLPHAGLVRLAVYDMAGREVQILQNGFLPGGAYRVHFDGEHLSSGNYFYRLSVREPNRSRPAFLQQTRMMTLLK